MPQWTWPSTNSLGTRYNDYSAWWRNQLISGYKCHNSFYNNVNYATTPLSSLFLSIGAFIALTLSSFSFFCRYWFWLDLSLQYKINSFFHSFVSLWNFIWQKTEMLRKVNGGLVWIVFFIVFFYQHMLYKYK